jgi:hypothetical protein
VNTSAVLIISISPIIEITSKRNTCRSGFTILLPVLPQEQSAVVLLLERALVSWSLAMDKHGEYEDLRSSVRWSVIPYVHRGM